LEFNLRPFQQPILRHGDVETYSNRILTSLVSLLYCFYHIPALLVGFFPWSIFLGPTIIYTLEHYRAKKAKQKTSDAPKQIDGRTLALCWFGVWLVFWSICKTKLPHYLLPAYPALALLVACFVERWQTDPASLRYWWLRNAWISMVLVGIGMMIAIPIVTNLYMPGEWPLFMLGFVPLLGGAWCWSKTSQGRHRQAIVSFNVTAVVFLTAIFGFAALRVDAYQNSRPMMTAIESDSCEDLICNIATYQFFRESMVYYGDRLTHSITVCEDNEKDHHTALQELQKFDAAHPHSYVITIAPYVPEIEKNFPDQYRVVFHQRRFLGPGEIIVVRLDRKR
jgi:4-amino-4-deoxy-L-arabinose transferase-like glycosyltransferase